MKQTNQHSLFFKLKQINTVLDSNLINNEIYSTILKTVKTEEKETSLLIVQQ